MFRPERVSSCSASTVTVGLVASMSGRRMREPVTVICAKADDAPGFAAAGGPSSAAHTVGTHTIEVAPSAATTATRTKYDTEPDCVTDISPPVYEATWGTLARLRVELWSSWSDVPQACRLVVSPQISRAQYGSCF